MRELEDYFTSLQRNGTMKIVELYERVQNCPHVVPRLYLMCCVGGVYITSLEAPSKDILKDMLEMAKGVQVSQYNTAPDSPFEDFYLMLYSSQMILRPLFRFLTPFFGAF